MCSPILNGNIFSLSQCGYLGFVEMGSYIIHKLYDLDLKIIEVTSVKLGGKTSQQVHRCPFSLSYSSWP